LNKILWKKAIYSIPHLRNINTFIRRNSHLLTTLYFGSIFELIFLTEDGNFGGYLA